MRTSVGLAIACLMVGCRNQQASAPEKSQGWPVAQALRVGAEERRFLLKTPTTSSKRLLLVFHGSGESAADFCDRNGVWGLAEEHQLAVACLEGPIRKLNGVQVSWDTFAPADHNPDVAFTSAVVGSIRERYAVDDSATWALGYSQGAYFSFLLAAARADLISGIALQQGSSPVLRPRLDRLLESAARKFSVAMVVGADDEIGQARHTAEALEQAGHRVWLDVPPVTQHLFIPEKTPFLLEFLRASADSLMPR